MGLYDSEFRDWIIVPLNGIFYDFSVAMSFTFVSWEHQRCLKFPICNGEKKKMFILRMISEVEATSSSLRISPMEHLARTRQKKISRQYSLRDATDLALPILDT